MTDNETRPYQGRAADAAVHLIDARSDALLDPSPYRTRCGRDVLEVYNTRTTTTCPACADTERTS